ncbi:hypothetical protein RHSP_48008 [Rhizobium freirei PRF 81]|uniref:Uncharacterized protein n=1 Tax=Rhizobium freirei PRF 81 TaxID=363754 RepID=N6V1S7_9HYPH|nr:hypothetical protein [Rhizobium freirei]ENN87840.1 hypothetical protein RHSP_48008 [Rhizobium freirei PRF 81]
MQAKKPSSISIMRTSHVDRLFGLKLGTERLGRRHGCVAAFTMQLDDFGNRQGPMTRRATPEMVETTCLDLQSPASLIRNHATTLPNSPPNERRTSLHAGAAAKYASSTLINTNYVDNTIRVNMIYVDNFARVGKCKNQWAND